jgi:hypothetical protein
MENTIEVAFNYHHLLSRPSQNITICLSGYNDFRARVEKIAITEQAGWMRLTAAF